MHINIAADGFIRWYARYFGRFVALRHCRALWRDFIIIYYSAFYRVDQCMDCRGPVGADRFGKSPHFDSRNTTLNPARLKENAARSLT
jgi:hypothetical protein